MDDERFERGWEKLCELNEPYAKLMRAAMEEEEPELFRSLVEFVFGDVLSRPVLDLKMRELATVAVLTALGNARPQLRLHIHGALNVGWKREEVHEIIMQQAIYAGFPAALNGITLAREVFAERDAQGLS
jgi:4-carboxymuconolactone decarboxylase